MSGRTRALAAALVLVGCDRLRPVRPPTDDNPTQVVAHADELVRDGSPRAARRAYRKVLHEHPGTPEAEHALYGLGRLYVDPKGPFRDYPAAYAAFGKLLAEYPDGPHAADAAAWHAALADLLRAQADLRSVRGDLDRLKQLDMEEEP